MKFYSYPTDTLYSVVHWKILAPFYTKFAELRSKPPRMFRFANWPALWANPGQQG